MSDRIGLWFVILWESDKTSVEVGVKSMHDLLEGNYGAFFSTTKRFLWFYLTISKPTLVYLNENERLKYNLTNNEKD